MSDAKNFSWKVLILGRGQQKALKIEQNLQEMGYKNGI
jgi:hypothetical protein